MNLSEEVEAQKHNTIFQDPYEKYWKNTTEEVDEYLKAEKEWLLDIIPQGNILELGAGDGRVTGFLADIGRVVGVDNAPVQLLAAQRRFRHQSECEFVLADATALPYENGIFRSVIAEWNFLGVLPNYQARSAVVREAFRVVERGGIVAGSVYSIKAGKTVQPSCYRGWGYTEPVWHPDPMVTARMNRDGKVFASRRFTKDDLLDLADDVGVDIRVELLTKYSLKWWGYKK